MRYDELKKRLAEGIAGHALPLVRDFWLTPRHADVYLAQALIANDLIRATPEKLSVWMPDATGKPIAVSPSTGELEIAAALPEKHPERPLHPFSAIAELTLLKNRPPAIVYLTGDNDPASFTWDNINSRSRELVPFAAIPPIHLVVVGASAHFNKEEFLHYCDGLGERIYVTCMPEPKRLCQSMRPALYEAICLNMHLHGKNPDNWDELNRAIIVGALSSLDMDDRDLQGMPYALPDLMP